MAQGQVRLLFSLVGQDKLSSAIEKSRKSLDGLADASDKAGSQAGQAFGSLVGTITGLPGKLSDLNAGFELVGKAVDFVSQGVEQLAEAEKDLNARRIFEQTQQGTQGATEAMEGLEEATRGAMNQKEIVNFSNSMRFAGLELDTISQTLNTAFTVSEATGREVVEVAETLRDSLITGSGTGFEMLGITLDLNKALEEEAQKIGKTINEMDTSEKAQKRLAVMSEVLEDRLVELGVDVGSLSTQFRDFKTDIDDAKDSAAQFAAEELGQTRREQEIEQVRASVRGLFDDFESRLNKNDTAAFIQKVAEVTGFSKELIEENTEALIKQGTVTETKLDLMAKRMIKRDEITTKSQQQARKRSNEQARKIEKADERARLVSVENLTAEMANLEKDKTTAIYTNNIQQITKLDEKIEDIGIQMAAARGEITIVEMEAQLSRVRATRNRDEANKARQQTLKELDQEAKALDERKKRFKVAAAARAAEQKRNEQALKQAFGIRDQMRIDDLKKQLRFYSAEALAREKATREILGTEKEQEKRSTEEKILVNQQLTQALLAIDQEYEAARIASVEEGRERIKAEKQQARDDEKKHLEQVEEFRRNHREQDIRQAEEFTSRAEALSGDLRRYDEDTATVMQGQADITNAIAQNAGNAAKQTAAAIAAGGRTTEALIKNDKIAAGTRAAFETAAGFASIAAGDVIGGTMHFTAAGLFAALAGGVGGKKGSERKGGSQRITRGGGGSAAGFGDGGTGNQVVVNVAGFVTGTTKEMGVQVANSINDVQSTGLSTGTV